MIKVQITEAGGKRIEETGECVFCAILNGQKQGSTICVGEATVMETAVGIVAIATAALMKQTEEKELDEAVAHAKIFLDIVNNEAQKRIAHELVGRRLKHDTDN